MKFADHFVHDYEQLQFILMVFSCKGDSLISSMNNPEDADASIVAAAFQNLTIRFLFVLISLWDNWSVQ